MGPQRQAIFDPRATHRQWGGARGDATPVLVRDAGRVRPRRARGDGGLGHGGGGVSEVGRSERSFFHEANHREPGGSTPT